MFSEFFGFDKEKATQIMLLFILKGKAFVEYLPERLQKQKSMQVNNYSQQNEHPLMSEIEPVEEDD